VTRRSVVAGLLLLATGCGPGGHPRPPVPPEGASAAADGWCTILRVVDGDTVRCTSGERVRLLMIDAPERSQGEYGARATRVLGEMLPVGSTARLELDVRERDRWGRILAHVHSEDGLWTNLEMVRRGYAVVTVYPPDVRHVERLRAAAVEAREAGRGLWGSGGFECEPGARRRGEC
jgi:micrococcal nuclease